VINETFEKAHRAYQASVWTLIKFDTHHSLELILLRKEPRHQLGLPKHSH
jgi:hypothetical protein